MKSAAPSSSLLELSLIIMAPKGRPKSGAGNKGKGKNLAEGEEAKEIHEKVQKEKAGKKPPTKKKAPVRKTIRLGGSAKAQATARAVAAACARDAGDRSSEDSDDDHPPPAKKKALNKDSPPASPRSVSPPPHGEDDESDDSDGSHESGADVEEEAVSPSPKKKRKKTKKGSGKPRGRKPAVVLTTEQEQDVLEWIKSNPKFYDKEAKGWLVQREHLHLWVDKAKQMGLGYYEELTTWWKTLRTRYTRVHLNKTKSGSGSVKKLTAKDQFAWDNAAFLHDHIRHQVNRNSTKEIRHQGPAPTQTPPPDLAEDVARDELDDLAQVVVPAAGGQEDTGNCILNIKAFDSIFSLVLLISKYLSMSLQLHVIIVCMHIIFNYCHYLYFQVLHVSFLRTSQGLAPRGPRRPPAHHVWDHHHHVLLDPPPWKQLLTPWWTSPTECSVPCSQGWPVTPSPRRLLTTAQRY